MSSSRFLGSFSCKPPLRGLLPFSRPYFCHTKSYFLFEALPSSQCFTSFMRLSSHSIPISPTRHTSLTRSYILHEAYFFYEALLPSSSLTSFFCKAILLYTKRIQIASQFWPTSAVSRLHMVEKGLWVTMSCVRLPSHSKPAANFGPLVQNPRNWSTANYSHFGPHCLVSGTFKAPKASAQNPRN